MEVPALESEIPFNKLANRDGALLTVNNLKTTILPNGPVHDI
jgi:hypothetical protein